MWYNESNKQREFRFNNPLTIPGFRNSGNSYRCRKTEVLAGNAGWDGKNGHRGASSVAVARWPRSSVGQDAPLARVKLRFDPGRGLLHQAGARLLSSELPHHTGTINHESIVAASGAPMRPGRLKLAPPISSEIDRYAVRRTRLPRSQPRQSGESAREVAPCIICWPTR